MGLSVVSGWWFRCQLLFSFSLLLRGFRSPDTSGPFSFSLFLYGFRSPDYPGNNEYRVASIEKSPSQISLLISAVSQNRGVVYSFSSAWLPVLRVLFLSVHLWKTACFFSHPEFDLHQKNPVVFVSCRYCRTCMYRLSIRVFMGDVTENRSACV